MKKVLLCIILFLIVVPKVEAKELYSCTVKYVDHDDYFEYIKDKPCVKNEVVITKEISEEKSQEEPVVEGIEEETKITVEDIKENTEEEKIETDIEEKQIIVENTIEEVDNNYYAVNGKLLEDNKVKVIDVSYYQGIIDWDKFKKESDCYGVIVRLGYKTTLDKYFKRNIEELTKLNIPYGIYLFSYALNSSDAKKEAEFVIEVFNKNKLNPTLGIYYDLESWKTNTSSTDSITKNGYNFIAKSFVEMVKEKTINYEVGVYSGRWYAMNRLGNIAKSYVSWVAEYNSTLKYDGPYKMWQYTSSGSEPGINGRVDTSYLYK